LTSGARLPVAPKLPTLIEQGVPIGNYGWWGMCGGAGIPRPVVDQINSVVVAAVNSPDYRSAMEKSGTVAEASTPDELGKIIAETVTGFDRLIKELDVKQIE
jgi:tripartite-type tricarboxylate transporter receptor subunit TctC